MPKNQTTLYGTGQGQIFPAPVPIPFNRTPATTDTNYPIGQQLIFGDSIYELTRVVAGAAHWTLLGSGSTGSINSITGDTGGAETPSAGNFNLLGTANQITVTGTANTETFHIPTTFIAPGSIASTTTITAATGLTVTAGGAAITGTTNINTTGSGVTSIGTGGTGATNIGNATGNTAVTGSLTASTTLTATSGAITATNGSFTAVAAGTGLVLPVGTASGGTPQIVNARVGSVTFTGVSIAAAADLTLTLTNSTITGSSTRVMLSMIGATTGSALSIKSVTPSAGSLAIVVTNGTGATTTTANITFDFIVLN